MNTRDYENGYAEGLRSLANARKPMSLARGLNDALEYMDKAEYILSELMDSGSDEVQDVIVDLVGAMETAVRVLKANGKGVRE